MLITTKLEPRHLPSSVTLKISSISHEVVEMLLAKEEKVISFIPDTELMDKIRARFPREYIMESFPKKFNRDETILFVSYFRPKAYPGSNPQAEGKIDFKIIHT